ncbi:TonB-dependent receptor domain-containing protein [Caulobacter sp. BE254]|uniref:TonB-dependent receptor domain-containing protein n=1 Tax=Caulobacter sp. BE254 TaxID=2817720 RepID=UPI002860AD79|nr:TonB-dependent receptor [Caulobacter sp. BE254]MDR7116287.1 outer membrane receptor protein involved in Fe transport [Caulobacter sp. BE254]
MKVLLLAAVAGLSPGLALAQAAAPPTQPAPRTSPGGKADAPTAVEGVTVTSDSTAMRTSIDRRSYSVANDLTAKTGSIADALRNIPSVEVDVQGNVSLRGDPNVTIMIDGKPSSMFNGDGKADALQQMPADQIDRVEVMTNPSAAYRPDGTAGIINLITKKTRKPGATGSFKLNVGPNSRYNTGVTGNLVKGKLTLSGDAGYRYDRQRFWSTDERETTPPAGAPVHTLQDGAFVNDGSAVNLRGGLDYNLTPKDRLSGEVRFRRMDYDADGEESFTDLIVSPTAPVYTRASSAGMKRDNTVASGDWRHQFKGAEHELDAHLEYEVTDFQRDGKAFIDNTIGADVYERFGFGADQDRANFKLDYTRPMPDEAKLKTGLDFEVVDNDYDNHGSTGPTAADQIADPRRTNRFLYDQDVYAGYVTYERPFGDVTVLGGLRAEQVEIRTNQLTSVQKDDNSYFHVYPSLHLGYTLSQTQTLTANYSKRVQRPQVQDLNPYPVYQDPKNFFAGNPDLKPQITDSYELGYQYRKGPASYLATFYYRESRDGVTSVVRDLGDGVFLTTRENLAKGRNGGLELVANGKLTPKLSYNVSGNAFWNEIQSTTPGVAGTREGTTLTGRASLSWQATPKDFLQLNGFTSGKRLTPQGYREPLSMLNLGYRRKVSDKLNFVVTANDVLKSFKDDSVLDTPVLRQRVERRVAVRAVFFGFTYALGGGKARPEQFDFGGGAVGG